MYKIEPLNKHPDCYQKVIDLIEESYKYSQDESFAIDFYPLINEKNW